MNDPDTYELAPHGGVKSNDPRPNMWAQPEGNWAKIELNGWNVHHTMGKNWARNANVHLWGWQFSDNHRSYVIKVRQGYSEMLRFSKNLKIQKKNHKTKKNQKSKKR